MTNDTARFDPATHKSVVSVGLDGNSRPMWRYLADMHLPDHQRRIVAPEHRPASVERPERPEANWYYQKDAGRDLSRGAQ